MGNEYKELHSIVVSKKLSKAFAKMYLQNNRLHDWYLASLYLANTGPLLQVYSTRGKSTLQLAFTTSGPGKGILLIYKNLYGFQVEHETTGDASFRSPTSFGRCMTSRFTADEDSHICHELTFEDGTMRIICESITHRRIVHNYWD